MQIFDIKYGDEQVVLTFDFTDELLDDEILIGPISVDITVTAGADANYLDLLNGAAALSQDLHMVMQPVKDGRRGCDYLLEVDALTTNTKKKLTRRGLLQVR